MAEVQRDVLRGESVTDLCVRNPALACANDGDHFASNRWWQDAR